MQRLPKWGADHTSDERTALPLIAPTVHHASGRAVLSKALMRAFSLSTCLLLAVAPAIHAQAALATNQTPMHWGPAPAVFPPGARMAVVSGDPSKAAVFTVQLAMPSGYKIAPHFHPTDETVEVKKGTLLVGMGDKFDLSKAKAMKAGEKTPMAAKAHHFAAAQGATFIQVTAMGPFALTYVNPADDPQKQVAKP